jgi:hypothetical protein
MKPGERLFQITSGAVFTFSALLFVALLLVISSGYPPRARYVPQTVGIFSIICLAIQLVLDIFPRLQNLFRKVEGGGVLSVEAQVKDARAGDGTDFTLELITYFWLGALLAGLLLVGFLITIPLYIFFYLRSQAQVTWFKSALYGLATWLFVDLLFVRLFEIRLYAGLLIEPFLD